VQRGLALFENLKTTQRNDGRMDRVEGVCGTDDLTFTVTW
jgi:hypothetical protein